jgi:hypothetical protein
MVLLDKIAALLTELAADGTIPATVRARFISQAN